jgi:hypothetical protein
MPYMNDDPVAREKLLLARAEIEATIKKYDIAAHVVLHCAPNASEVIINLEPSYSRVKLDKGRAVISSKLADYNGDKEAKNRDLTATCNMVSSMFELTGHAAMFLSGLDETLGEATGATHTSMKHIKPN